MSSRVWANALARMAVVALAAVLAGCGDDGKSGLLPKEATLDVAHSRVISAYFDAHIKPKAEHVDLTLWESAKNEERHAWLSLSADGREIYPWKHLDSATEYPVDALRAVYENGRWTVFIQTTSVEFPDNDFDYHESWPQLYDGLIEFLKSKGV